MAIKTTLKMGAPGLFQKSQPLVETEFGSAALHELIQDMKDTMADRGGVGIAAPQIGCNKRVIMFGFDSSPRYPNEKSVPFTILINPEIELLSEETIAGWEGCLSVPGLRGLVPRYVKIKYRGFDETGARIERIADGFHARMVQHECDHLDGILFPLRVADMRNFGFEDVLWPQIAAQKI